MSRHFPAAWGFAVLGFVIGYAVAGYYAVLVYRSGASDADRQFWTGALFRFFPISGPIFWYRVIWKRLDLASATRRA